MELAHASAPDHLTNPIPDLGISWLEYLTPLSWDTLHFITSLPFNVTNVPPPPKIFNDGLHPPKFSSSPDPDLTHVNTPYSPSVFHAYLSLSGLLD
jgi:hypothetical protein